MENKEKRIENLNQMAYIAFKESNFFEAIRLYKEVIEIDNTDDLTHNNLSVCYRQLGKIVEALYHINLAIRLKPQNALYYSTKSTILVKTDKPKDALKAIDIALEIEPNDEFLINKVTILRKLKYFKLALEIIDSLIEHKKNDNSLNCYKAILLFESKQFEKSNSIFKELLGTDSDSIANLYLSKLKKLN